MSLVVNTCIVLLVLGAGTGPYVLLSNLTNFSHFIDLFIAIASRLLSLAIYRWRHSRESHPSSPFLIFEWVFPVIFMAEVAFLIPNDGKPLMYYYFWK
jgi:hypothetical protein